MMKPLLPAALAMLLLSCAGTKQFTVKTEPSGAEIHINGRNVGTSNLTTTVSQKRSLGIVATKPGYEVATVTVPTKPDFWLALVWTKNDPKAQVIEEDSVTIPLTPIKTAEVSAPVSLPAFQMPSEGAGNATIPTLRPLPQF